jgi:hypothetical protein
MAVSDESSGGVPRIGVIVVHGIGEQRRFEHIDGQVRSIVAALRKQHGPDNVSVEIAPATAAAFRADQDSWSIGATIRVLVNHPHGPKELSFHEVWWADVNEPYSLFKQIRFWRWGLTIWLYPGKDASSLGSADLVRAPATGHFDAAWVRLRLFAVAVVAVTGAASIGMVTFLAERVLNLRPFDFIRVFVNYVAGVKLYSQKRRLGPGFPAKNQDILDTIDEPPRVSIRRRMIRVIADVALADYERWYVMAHSLGSVVAFNGLMESSYAWPGYLDRERWDKLRAKQRFAGPARPGWQPPGSPTLPGRPLWIAPTEIAYRSKIFEKFHGMLTFGSPLEKFAAIWPAKVPVSREPAFRPGSHWINAYDPIDPVSGVLQAFEPDPKLPATEAAACCPTPQNVGFAAGWGFLVNHLTYLDLKPGKLSLAEYAAEWLVAGNPGAVDPARHPAFYRPGKGRHWFRSALSWIYWGVIFAVLLGLGSIVTPIAFSIAYDAVVGIYHHFLDMFNAPNGGS